MYSTCIFCHSALEANDAIEHFPVGRRLAFDPSWGSVLLRPGGHIIAVFDSRLPEFNCRNAPLTVAPGGKLTVADMRNGWGSGCRIPDQAYFVGTAGRGPAFGLAANFSRRRPGRGF